MDIAYGIRVQKSGDPYLSLIEEALDGLSQAGTVGAFWVDLFPILKHVPSWFPGAGFQKKATHWREVNASMIEKPFRYVQEQLVGEYLFNSPRACLYNNRTEGWQSSAVFGSDPHRGSSSQR